MMEVPALSDGELQGKCDNEASAAVRTRVVAAREIQLARQGKANAALGTQEIEIHCVLDAPARELLKQAIYRFNLSGRAYHRVLKVARSIADLAATATVLSAHVAEAIHYRRGLSEA